MQSLADAPSTDYIIHSRLALKLNQRLSQLPRFLRLKQMQIISKKKEKLIKMCTKVHWNLGVLYLGHNGIMTSQDQTELLPFYDFLMRAKL